MRRSLRLDARRLMNDDPTYDISVAAVIGNASGCEAGLHEAITATLARHRVAAARISVALVDDNHIAQLNKRYLKREGPTDVLSFDLRDGDCAGDSSGKAVDGEIVVSVDTAAREALRRGHSLDAEVTLYAVHGMLHLLGYSDREERDAARMHEVEDEILTAAGMGAVYRSRRL